MALKTCHECGKQYSSEAKACIHCGARNGSHRGLGYYVSRFALVAGLLVVGFIAVGALLLSQVPPEQREAKRRDREAIELCREQQNDELSDLSTRRMIREACDKMASNFRATYGVDP